MRDRRPQSALHQLRRPQQLCVAPTLAQRLERTGMIAPAQRRLGCSLQVDVQMIQRLSMLAQRQQPENQVEARLRIRRVTPDKQASLFDRGGEIAHYEQECLSLPENAIVARIERGGPTDGRSRLLLPAGETKT